MSAELAKDMPVITMRELMQKLKAAVERMSVANPHRDLFVQCAQTIFELQTRVRDRERQLVSLQKAAAEVLDAEEKARVELITPGGMSR